MASVSSANGDIWRWRGARVWFHFLQISATLPILFYFSIGFLMAERFPNDPTRSLHSICTQSMLDDASTIEGANRLYIFLSFFSIFWEKNFESYWQKNVFLNGLQSSIIIDRWKLSRRWWKLFNWPLLDRECQQDAIDKPNGLFARFRVDSIKQCRWRTVEDLNLPKIIVLFWSQRIKSPKKNSGKHDAAIVKKAHRDQCIEDSLLFQLKKRLVREQSISQKKTSSKPSSLEYFSISF